MNIVPIEIPIRIGADGCAVEAGIGDVGKTISAGVRDDLVEQSIYVEVGCAPRKRGFQCRIELVGERGSRRISVELWRQAEVRKSGNQNVLRSGAW